MSLTALILIFFGIVAVVVLVVSIRMPRKFYKEEKIRTDLKKRIYSAQNSVESEEDQVS
jgi:hypothetical protein